MSTDLAAEIPAIVAYLEEHGTIPLDGQPKMYVPYPGHARRRTATSLKWLAPFTLAQQEDMLTRMVTPSNERWYDPEFVAILARAVREGKR